VRILLWIACALVWLVSGGVAQERLDGTFVAAKACPALQSIKKRGNPGNARVTVGTSYRLVGKNRRQATHYWIEVPGAVPARRWVESTCGNVVGTDAKSMPKDTGKSSAFYILAISWEPAFCEKMTGKAECQSQTASRYDASHFSLHGLWPQPRRNVFCGVEKGVAAADDAHQWDALPDLQLSAGTKAALDRVMPGTQSLLERHEWIKHGTCYPGREAESYFRDSIRLVDEINGSDVRTFVADNIGQRIETTALRAMFDKAFGAGAGDRVRVACSAAGLISELTIGLRGDIPSGASLRDLIAASAATDPGCPVGVVDAAD
jgi:ribonuclease T2